jgi:MYXO-CTERM domain-containing protein
MNRAVGAWLTSAAVGIVAFASLQAQAAPPPQIRFLDVDSASPGSFVGIYGVGFGTIKGMVQFGGATSIDIPTWTDRLIIARVPDGAATGTVTVKTASQQELKSADHLGIHAGRIYVVSSNGSDAGAGDETDPFQSLHKAMSVVQPGDTVLIRQGKYDEQDTSGMALPAFYIRSNQSGTATHPVTWRGYADEVPVITGTQVTAKDSPIVYVEADQVRLARLEINGENNNASGVTIVGSSVWAVGLEVHGFGSAGIAGGEGAGTLLAGNLVHDGGTRPNLDHGIILTGPGATVRDNEIRDLPNGYGIFLQYPTQSGAKVYANFVHDVAGGGIGLSRVGGGNRIFNNLVWRAGLSQGCRCGIQVAYGSLAGEQSSGDAVYFNTFAGPTPTGVLIADRAGSVELYSNVFSGFKVGIEVEDDVSQVSLASSYNLWFGLGADPQFKWAGAWVGLSDFQALSKQEPEAIVADPKLVDQEHGDLHLTAASPAVDVASGDNFPQVDYDGMPRPQGKALDRGAYELEGGGSVDGGSGGSGGNADGGGGSGAVDGSSGGPDADAGGGAAPSSGGDDGGGCGCAVPSNRSSTGWPAIAIAAAVAAAARRRRR